MNQINDQTKKVEEMLHIKTLRFNIATKYLMMFFLLQNKTQNICVSYLDALLKNICFEL
jgi:hypothetical protein